MADENAAAGAKPAGEGGEGAAAKQNAPGDAGKPEGQQDNNAGGQKPEGEKPKGEPANQPDEGDEPPVRGGKKSPKDFIIARKQRQLEKAKNKQVEAEDEEGEDEPEGDEDEVSPEDEKIIAKVIDRKLSPLLQQQEQAAIDGEIKGFLAENPDFAQFEGKVRKYAAHPSRRNIPIKSLFYEVAGPSLMKMGADRSKQADDKAKNGQAGGNGVRGDEAAAGKDAWSESKEAFNKRVQGVLQKRE